MLQPSEKEIHDQLDRLLEKSVFSSSPRAAKLLTYLVGKTLAGEEKELKGYSIGVDVFDRPEDFDPQSDSIVRVQAGRLRKALSLYYLTTGQQDPVIITLPKGRYIPVFTLRNEPSQNESEQNHSKQETQVSTNEGNLTSVTTHAPPSDLGVTNTVIDVGQSLTKKNGLSSNVDKVYWENRARLKRIDRKLTGLSALVGVALIALISIVYFGRSTPTFEKTFEEATMMPDGPSVTVMTFQAVETSKTSEGGGNSQILSAGLQYELINNLSRFRDIKVVTDKTIGESLTKNDISNITTEYYLTGIIQTSDNTVRISSALFRESDNQSIWSKTYDETLDDAGGLLRIQSSIASDVATALGQPLSVLNKAFQERLKKAENREFDHHYCLYRFYEYVSDKSETLHSEIRDCLETAVAEDPEFSSGWAALSWVYGDEDRNKYNVVSRDLSPYDMALAAAKKGVEADRQNAMAYQYLAIISFTVGDDKGFKKAANKALELNPNDPEVLADVGSHLIQMGNDTSAPRMVEKAIKLNADHPPWYHGSLSMHYYIKGNMAEVLSNTAEYYEDGGLQSSVLYIAALVRNEKMGAAKEVLDKLLAKYPNFENDCEAVLKSWRLPGTMYDDVLDDLRLAGLEIA